jgi:hypothetical protein
MKRSLKISVLLITLIIALVGVTVVSAAPLRGTILCPNAPNLAKCSYCGEYPSGGTAGWWCKSNGDIKYYKPGCSYQYYSDCTPETCHCMPIGTSDHCQSWQH